VKFFIESYKNKSAAIVSRNSGRLSCSVNKINSQKILVGDGQGGALGGILLIYLSGD
jgi:hypothetical protein